MPLDANDSRLVNYTSTYVKEPNKGERFLYNVKEFYMALINLKIMASDEELITLYKVFSAGYDQGYSDGY